MTKGLVPPYGAAVRAEGPSSGPTQSDVALNRYQRQRLEAFLSGTAWEFSTLRLIAVQVQFADSLMGGQPGSRRRAVHDSTWFANELAHMADYYRGASRGRFTVEWTIAPGLFTLPNGMRYYGDDRTEETRVIELAQSAIDSVDAGFDLSQYHTVFIIHAGAGQETDVANDSREQIWSSFYDLADIQAAFPDSIVRGLATDDSSDGEPFYVDNFCIVPEDATQDYQVLGTLGTWAFEIGSRVGLLPMFDATPEGFPDSQGVGDFCVMAYGLYNALGFVPAFPCAFNRLIAGWIDPVVVDAEEAPITVTLTDINGSLVPDTVCVKIPITESEYYLVVNRVHDSNFDSLFTFVDRDSDLVPDNADSLGGAEFDFFLTDVTNPGIVRYDPRYGFNVMFRHTGSGLYVWHVDEEVVRRNVEAGYLPDDFVARKGVDLEEADGVQDLDGDGSAAFALGSHFDSFRAGDGGATSFGPSTKPNSMSNRGAPTGIMLDRISGIGHRMTFRLSRAIDYDEVRTRWAAAGAAQPATAVDIDGVAGAEIVVLADTGAVYAFRDDGSEYDDADADPATVAPYLVAPDALWAGPPAFAELDGAPGVEILAGAVDGRLFAWKGTGEEVTDGDDDPTTLGVFHAGDLMATPPLMVDFNKDGLFEVSFVEKSADSLTIRFLGSNGSSFTPAGDTFGALWPLSVRGHRAAPLALARTRIGGTEGQTGLVLGWVDTVGSAVYVSYTPFMWTGGVELVGQPPAESWTVSLPLAAGFPVGEQYPSAPAVGDMDADGSDEVVLSMPDGRLIILDVAAGGGAVTPTLRELRAGSPSGPALGDVDLDGVLEIALWDAEFMYLLESNGRDMTNWPKRIVPVSSGEQPPASITRGLESPVVGDIDGDGAVEVVFALQDGTVVGLERSGEAAPHFPRVGPARTGVTPSVAELATNGGLSLVSVGALDGVRSFDNVVDTVATASSMTLSIQSLPGSDAAGRLFWPSYQAGPTRQAVVAETVPLKTSSDTIVPGSFMIYPNPVPGAEVHARVSLNRSAEIRVEIYNLEGQRAFRRDYQANPNDLIDTPFDEAIDVSGLKSGVYMMRIRVGGAETLVLPFAVRR